MINVFGTLGPACNSRIILKDMFAYGMTGIRINLSHVMLSDCIESIDRIHDAAKDIGIVPLILIDMQGPELRIGRFEGEISLEEDDLIQLGKEGIPLSDKVIAGMQENDEILLDDGKIMGIVTSISEGCAEMKVQRGGRLTQRKSILIKGKDIILPAITDDDMENLKIAKGLGVTGIMQPFVRSRADLLQVKDALETCGCSDLRIYGKIENRLGIRNITDFMDLCDEIIIARGDLGNSMPLWELPRVQKEISKVCNDNKKPFMVVTQMLASMEKSAVPTRAEVSDIYNAVLDGAASVMVTGETAIGENPVEVIKYLYNTSQEALQSVNLRKY
ncbi:pyruvate kinase [Butyrivibrio sp. WCE2006]|uniref:pyruvate kinase n=1 Tax=Butyrivibrio sp. WCE2006 TaxID=1410611 RepID=UPI0005D136DC|nr:pyruvate kinase [Butyrivibrio sp. WCE2006]